MSSQYYYEYAGLKGTSARNMGLSCLYTLPKRPLEMIFKNKGLPLKDWLVSIELSLSKFTFIRKNFLGSLSSLINPDSSTTLYNVVVLTVELLISMWKYCSHPIDKTANQMFYFSVLGLQLGYRVTKSARNMHFVCNLHDHELTEIEVKMNT